MERWVQYQPASKLQYFRNSGSDGDLNPINVPSLGMNGLDYEPFASARGRADVSLLCPVVGGPILAVITATFENRCADGSFVATLHGAVT